MKTYHSSMGYLYLLRSGWRVKIGIGSKLQRRVSQVDKTTRGKQRLVLAVILPFKTRQVEAYLHRRYKRHHAPLRAGSGRSEYYWAGLWTVECIVLMLLIQFGQWALVWFPIYLILLIFVR